MTLEKELEQSREEGKIRIANCKCKTCKYAVSSDIDLVCTQEVFEPCTPEIDCSVCSTIPECSSFEGVEK